MANGADNLAEQITMAMQAPGQPGSTVNVTITAAEAFNTVDPADVAVLMFWRCIEQTDQEATTHTVWRYMASQGLRDSDEDLPIQEKTVQDAVDRLMARGILPQGGESL